LSKLFLSRCFYETGYCRYPKLQNRYPLYRPFPQKRKPMLKQQLGLFNNGSLLRGNGTGTINSFRAF
jgi:hypothetical protein